MRSWTCDRPERQQRWSFSIICLVLLSTACAYDLRIRPMPLAERLPLHVEVEDLTRSGADSLIAATLQRCLAEDYIYVLHWSNPARSDGHLALIVAQNPFRPTAPTEAPLLVARADVERLDYGPASALDAALAGFVFFGPLGAGAAMAMSDAEYVAALQLRFDPVGGSTARVRNLVQVARSGDVRRVSRRDLVARATSDAVEIVLMDLARSARKSGHLKVKEQSYPALSENDARERLYRWTGILDQ